VCKLTAIAIAAFGLAPAQDSKSSKLSAAADAAIIAGAAVEFLVLLAVTFLL
jgi:hypothetical protein